MMVAAFLCCSEDAFSVSREVNIVQFAVKNYQA